MFILCNDIYILVWLLSIFFLRENSEKQMDPSPTIARYTVFGPRLSLRRQIGTSWWPEAKMSDRRHVSWWNQSLIRNFLFKTHDRIKSNLRVNVSGAFQNLSYETFLVACTRLYKSLCRSAHSFIHLGASLFRGYIVRPSVHPLFITAGLGSLA